VYGRARLYGVVQDGGHDYQLYKEVRQAVAQPLGFFTSCKFDICLVTCPLGHVFIT